MSKQGNRRACVFCGATDQKISKEHVFAEKFRKHIEGGEGGLISRERIHATRDDKIVSHKRWREIPIDWKVSAPCEPCNRGWMDDMDREALPILLPMLKDEGDVELGADAQEALAQWATLRVMVGQHGHPKERQRVIPKRRYHRFYQAREIPPGAQIWVARYSGAGPWPTNYQHREIFISRPDSAGPNAHITAFSVGYAAFVYWGHEVEDGATVHLGEGMKPYLLPIWPIEGPVLWPPKGTLGASGLDAVVMNLVGTS